MSQKKRVSGFLMGGVLSIALAGFAPVVSAQGGAGGGVGGEANGANGGAANGGATEGSGDVGAPVAPSSTGSGSGSTSDGSMMGGQATNPVPPQAINPMPPQAINPSPHNPSSTGTMGATSMGRSASPYNPSGPDGYPNNPVPGAISPGAGATP